MGSDDITGKSSGHKQKKGPGAPSSKELELLDSILKRRGFFWQAEEIYGGMKGFYDYGVLGVKLKHNIQNIWRRLFVVENGFLEIDGASIGSEKVFSASGHLEKFVDVMVNCLQCGASFRADHLLKGHVENADGMVLEDIDSSIEGFGIKCEQCGGEFTKSRTQNLMFEIAVGRDTTAYLRPETAQSIFLNFPNLYRFNREKMPFGVAQLGRGFRNEISPRQGLIRLREFSMAEVEYFYDKSDTEFLETLRRKILEKDYPFIKRMKGTAFTELMETYGATLFDTGTRYDDKSKKGQPSSRSDEFLARTGISTILDEELCFVAANKGDPEELHMSFAQALKKELICSPLLCHHLILAYAFMRTLGFQNSALRFRQHLPKEMAHYASDCWDLEVGINIGPGEKDWIETIGIADRSAYDLSSHMEASGRDLRVFEKFAEPRKESLITLKPDMRKLGQQFKKDAVLINEALTSAPQEILEKIRARMVGNDGGHLGGELFVDLETKEVLLEDPGGFLSVPQDHVTLEETTKTIAGRKYIPSVIEPSYGIDRIIYGLLNNSIHHEKKEGEDYTYFSLSPSVAPIKTGIFPLVKDERLVKLAKDIHEELKGCGIEAVYDESGSVGRRYARMDEIGTPFCITIDFESLEDETATIRFIDTRQIRVPIKHLARMMIKFVQVF